MIVKEITHVGMVRDINEDSILTFKNDEFYLLIVADGMGGHSGGEIASEIAVTSIKDFIENSFSVYPNKEELIREAILLANKRIYEKSLNDSDLKGMGTTITISLILKNDVYIGHVGDSRAYLLKGEIMHQITEDHSYINELLKKGAITEEEAKVHPMKNIITRAVGTDRYIVIDTYEGSLNKGDTLIMCSDGLTRHVTDNEILEIVKSEDNQVESLLNLANARGGKDNISIIVARKEDYDA
ncbi:Stp1/IreP family PP2C-type Ser/Thr phosphatase [Clostridium cylindrosporum]|uniref:Protein phosphatase PrpC n=1 Tax=Clostridium cylindrosporum DSM 605 TaxID=1121307 RepID=A0A0J8D5P4_CLOCY|nr:Stp1/IreP family PP2C-type Ser/Thr phosphatase [Clostridium cylindrosporum]KMT21455.1 protein phosphatase PrpC [Clostridium cylindrosporum DSM 605]